jgi:hypothetical protein
MSGLVRICTNETLTVATPYPCTWIGWYYENSFLSQLLHIFYSADRRQPPAVTWKMTLRSLCDIPHIKTVEIFPIGVDTSFLLEVITRESLAATGWDLVQEHLNEISVQREEVLILEDIKWEIFFRNESISLTTSEEILRRYIPSAEKVRLLREQVLRLGKANLVTSFNDCFPHLSINYEKMHDEEGADTTEQITNLLRYYESLPPFDNNLRKIHELRSKRGF